MGKAPSSSSPLPQDPGGGLGAGAAGRPGMPYAGGLRRFWVLFFDSCFLRAGWELAVVSSHHVAMEEAGGCDERLPLIAATLGHRILGGKCRGAACCA